MARLRRIDEPLTAAWDIHRDSFRPGEDLNGDEDDENPTIIIPHRLDGQIVGYTSAGKYEGFYKKGEGIDDGSACARAGCSEVDGDHACGGTECGFVLFDGKGSDSAYNGWRVSVEEMKIMTCVQAIFPLATNGVDWYPEDDDEDFERSSKYHCVLTAVSDSAPDEFNVNHVPYRHGIGGEILVCEAAYGDPEWGVPFHGPCYQILKRVAKERYPKMNLLDGLLDLRDVRAPFCHPVVFHCHTDLGVL